MKKTVTIIFLCLANLILLAHIVVPHHHHNAVVACFLSPEHDNAEESCPSSHDHEKSHHHEGNTENCLVKEIFVRVEKDKKAACSDCSHIQLSLCLPKIFLNLSLSENIDTDGFSHPPKPYLVSYLHSYIASSLGLRAPPAC